MTYRPPFSPPIVIDDDTKAIGEVLFNVYGTLNMTVGASDTFEKGRGHWLAIAAILVEELELLGWARPNGG
jgi:hypothetical protein